MKSFGKKNLLLQKIFYVQSSFVFFYLYLFEEVEQTKVYRAEYYLAEIFC